jgi:hypothetical protein
MQCHDLSTIHTKGSAKEDETSEYKDTTKQNLSHQKKAYKN